MQNCSNCPMLDSSNICQQYLGESIDWQWMPRTDDSSKFCHYNYTYGDEYDPYSHLREAELKEPV